MEMDRKKIIGIAIAVLVVVAAIVVPIVLVTGGDDGDDPYTLTILHNNDGESKLLYDEDSSFPGIARFINQLEAEQAAADRTSDGVITLTSGDNFLASKELNISLEGDIFYDALALSGVYDAMALGNHDFDFGPDVTARFVNAFDPAIPFLSANTDVTNEPVLQDLVDNGRLANSTVIKTGGRDVGVIGAVTQRLRSISSPRNAVIGNVADAVRAEVQKLTDDGVDIIILVSHLQGVDEELALIKELSNIDVVIAGGGDELLRNATDTCFDEQNAGSDEPEVPYGPYPIIAGDSTNTEIPVVTGPGGYRCFGRLDVTFDKDGVVTEYNGRAIGVSLSAPADLNIQENVEDPLQNAVAGLEREVVGVSDFALDGRRSQVRTVSTNLGHLLADAFIWSADQRGSEYGLSAPHVSISNGGGMRNDAVIPAGSVTVSDTFDVAPFSNKVVQLTISRETFKALMETTVSGVPEAEGRFAQIGGFTLEYSTVAEARVFDDECAVSVEGSRVLNATLNDGTSIISNGEVVPGGDVELVITDFLANGGDCYPIEGISFTDLGLTYQQALADFIKDGLGGSIDDADNYSQTSSRITARQN